MAKVAQQVIESFFEILKVVETFQDARDASWYRGTGDATYSLIPSLVRKSPAPSAESLSKAEKAIANTFAQRSPPFVTMDFSSEWRMLFYMQHYGIPTRLLDWTESPFVGLYFALMSVKRSRNGKPLTDAALWLCDPVAWNRKALDHISYSGGILDEFCEEMKSYRPSADLDQRLTLPVMMYGNHNSARIVAQRGVFAIFGKGLLGMEAVYEQERFPSDCLKKVVIKREAVDDVLKSLHRKGIAESTIYPDLYGLSMEIKRTFGYH